MNRRNSLCCLVCTDSVIDSPLPCQCLICIPCLSQWLSCEIQEHFLNSESYVRCPNSQCRQRISVSTMLVILPPKDTEELSSLMLKHYIQQAPDVINCTKGTCKYYGIMPEKDCPNDLICEDCGHKWKEKSQLNNIETFISKLTNISEVWNDTQTALYHLLFTVTCPRCSIPIKKMGGCDHMTCKKCAHEFCWTCKQDHFQHSSERCGSNMFIKTIILFFFVLHLGILSRTDEFLYNIIIGGARLFLKMCFFNLTFLIVGLLFFSLICLWKERASIYGNKQKLLWYGLWFAGMTYITSWHIPYLIYNHAEEMLWALGTETVIIGVISSSYFIIQTWLKYVL